MRKACVISNLPSLLYITIIAHFKLVLLFVKKKKKNGVVDIEIYYMYVCRLIAVDVVDVVVLLQSEYVMLRKHWRTGVTRKRVLMTLGSSALVT